MDVINILVLSPIMVLINILRLIDEIIFHSRNEVNANLKVSLSKYIFRALFYGNQYDHH